MGGLTATAIVFAVSGLFERNPFPLLPIFMLFLLGSAVVFGTSEFGGRVARGYSLSILAGFQSFRLPLALFCTFFVNKSKVTAWIFNGIGALLLMNVIRVVVPSAPLPISWHLENPFQLPFHFPYVLIAPLCVWPACVGHVVLARALMTQK
ncbi:hypothetical protein EBZ80_08055 [bacterium]|nr:hypothetical protein [bacterium]